jgi:hypothetical protein
MVIIQKKMQVIRHSLTKALLITVGIAAGSEISGMIHQNYFKIFNLEYALVFSICFLVSAFIVWITASRNYQIQLDNKGIQIVNEAATQSFQWDEVKKLSRPNLLRACWTFSLKQGGKIKLLAGRFDKPQRIALAREINNRFTLR